MPARVASSSNSGSSACLSFSGRCVLLFLGTVIAFGFFSFIFDLRFRVSFLFFCWSLRFPRIHLKTMALYLGSQPPLILKPALLAADTKKGMIVFERKSSEFSLHFGSSQKQLLSFRFSDLGTCLPWPMVSERLMDRNVSSVKEHENVHAPAVSYLQLFPCFRHEVQGPYHGRRHGPPQVTIHW